MKNVTLHVGQRRTRREASSLCENNRIGQLDLGRSDQGPQIVIGTLGRLEKTFVPTGWIDAQSDMGLLDDGQQLGQQGQFPAGEAGEAIDPEAGPFEEIGLGDPGAGVDDLSVGIDESPLERFGIASEDQAQVGEFQGRQAVVGLR